METNRDLLSAVHNFNAIGQVVPPGPTFNADRVCFHTGMQLEEMAEKIAVVAEGAVTLNEREYLRRFASELDMMGRKFKASYYQGAVLRADREALLDADIDIAVVTAGSMQYQTPHYRLAVDAVLGANDAKFPDGIANRDPVTNKILKPAGWKPADLTPFLVPRND